MDFSHFSKPSEDFLRFQAAEIKPNACEDIIWDAKANRDNWLQMSDPKPIPPFLASKVTIKNITVPTLDSHCLAGRLFYPLSRPFSHSLLPLYFYVHGGGFLHGSLAASDFDCARICNALGVVVCHVDYRYTDKWTYPTPYEDVWTSFKFAIGKIEEWGVDEGRIIVAGESAGANLAVGICVRAVKEGVAVKGLAVGSPFFCRPSLFPARAIKEGKSSLEVHVEEPGPSRKMLEWFMELLDPTGDATNYDVNPVLRPVAEWKGMPRTYVQIAGMDPMRDEGLLWVKNLEEAGVDVKKTVYPGLGHAFHHKDGLNTSKVYDEDHDKEVDSMLSSWN